MYSLDRPNTVRLFGPLRSPVHPSPLFPPIFFHPSTPVFLVVRSFGSLSTSSSQSGPFVSRDPVPSCPLLSSGTSALDEFWVRFPDRFFPSFIDVSLHFHSTRVRRKGLPSWVDLLVPTGDDPSRFSNYKITKPKRVFLLRPSELARNI